MVRWPAHWARAGYGVPKVCVRHGEPEVVRPKVKFRSPRPDWLYVLLLFGVLPFFLLSMVLQQAITVAGWPFCEQCRAMRRQRLALGIGLTAAGLTTWVLGLVLGPLPDAVRTLLPLSVLVTIAGIVYWSLSAWAVIGKARASKDGQWLEVTYAGPAFVSYVQAATAHAERQAATTAAATHQPSTTDEAGIVPA